MDIQWRRKTLKYLVSGWKEFLVVTIADLEYISVVIIGVEKEKILTRSKEL